MESAELPCEKKTCLGFNWTTLRPTPASSKKVARSKVMLLTSVGDPRIEEREKIDGPAKMTLLAYSCDLCPVSDTTRTLSGIVGLAHTDWHRVLSESEDYFAHERL